MLFFNPIGGFSWLFLAMVAIDDGGSRLDGAQGTPSYMPTVLWVTGDGSQARGLLPFLPFFFVSSSSFSSFFLSQHEPSFLAYVRVVFIGLQGSLLVPQLKASKSSRAQPVLPLIFSSYLLPLLCSCYNQFTDGRRWAWVIGLEHEWTCHVCPRSICLIKTLVH